MFKMFHVFTFSWFLKLSHELDIFKILLVEEFCDFSFVKGDNDFQLFPRYWLRRVGRDKAP